MRKRCEADYMGARLRGYRAAHDVTQIELANRILAPRISLARWEINAVAPDPRHRRRVEAVLAGERVTLASELRRARRLLAYTQDELAAALGVSRRALQAWELGEQSPRGVASIIRLLDRLTGELL